MKIDIQDIKFWMDAIRNSEDKYRTLESFWGGQLQSKVWLIENLKKQMPRIMNASIVIHGGWNGILSSMLFNSTLGIKHITSVDIDPNCEETAFTVNKRQEMEGKFNATTADMTEYQYETNPHVVINTSCEHITQTQYNKWLDNIPGNPLIVLQSNNYFGLEEHINCSESLKEFVQKSNLDVIIAEELKIENVDYTRFMIIGNKNV